MKVVRVFFSNHFFKFFVYAINVILQNLTLVLFYRLFRVSFPYGFAAINYQRKQYIEMCKNVFFSANSEI